MAAKFQATWKRAEISNDDFIRTTEERHRLAVDRDVAAAWSNRGDIYAADYEGLYCDGCEDWKTDDELVVEDGEKLCPIHRAPVERVKEKNYFFRLSTYQQRAAGLLRRQPELHPARVALQRGGLVRVGRPARSVGVAHVGEVGHPGARAIPAHTVYVWIDALTNYLTALGGPRAVDEDEPGARRCGRNSHHLIAKDILRFHAVYWPAMLMAVGLPPPKAIFCHGYLTVKGQKISKSIPATRVDPNAIADELGVDPLRYFVLREYTFGGDGDFSYEALFQRYESDLGNDLGNLLNRTVSLARQLPDAPLLPPRSPHAGRRSALDEDDWPCSRRPLAALRRGDRGLGGLRPVAGAGGDLGDGPPGQRLHRSHRALEAGQGRTPGTSCAGCWPTPAR